ncbi:hypothetical protein [Duganella radicis]|uniref:Uncharacterized protein n=1 Tax=Duganella radicis TaxID=551988 RepID=A0A6L6PFY7_9BURK|nr:hypothetical protein [Duganella radicis]MTV37471.1 hypothetical protein [Duganella radicis]
MKLIQHWMLCAALAACTLSASAQNNPPPPPDGQPPGPPPEAIAACKGKAEGAKVEFKGRRGETVKGTCKKMRDLIVAVPEGGRPPPPPRD